MNAEGTKYDSVKSRDEDVILVSNSTHENTDPAEEEVDNVVDENGYYENNSKDMDDNIFYPTSFKTVTDIQLDTLETCWQVT